MGKQFIQRETEDHGVLTVQTADGKWNETRANTRVSRSGAALMFAYTWGCGFEGREYEEIKIFIRLLTFLARLFVLLIGFWRDNVL